MLVLIMREDMSRYLCPDVLCIFFFEKHSTDADAHKYARTLIPTPMSISERLSRQILEIDKVTTGAPLSMGMSPTTESTNAIKS